MTSCYPHDDSGNTDLIALAFDQPDGTDHRKGLSKVDGTTFTLDAEVTGESDPAIVSAVVDSESTEARHMIRADRAGTTLKSRKNGDAEIDIDTNSVTHLGLSIDKSASPDSLQAIYHYGTTTTATAQTDTN